MHIFAPTNSSAEIIHGTTIYKFYGCTPFNLHVIPNKTFDYPIVVCDEIFMFNSM